MDINTHRLMMGAAGASSGGASYWFSSISSTFDFNGSALASVGPKIAADSAGNVYVSGSRTYNTSYRTLFVLKLDDQGAIAWQKLFSDSLTYAGGTTSDIAVNSSGTAVYVAFESLGSSPLGAYLVKFDTTNGNITWQRELGTNGFSTAVQGVAVDSSENIYIGFSSYEGGTGSNGLILAKYNSSGTLQWQRKITRGTGGSGGKVAVTNDGNYVYIVGHIADDSYVNQAYVIQYNSSGTLQWQRLFQSTAGAFSTAVGVDSANAVYTMFLNQDTGQGTTLAKWSSGGGLAWQRKVSGGNIGNPIDRNQLRVSSNDVIHLVLSTTGTFGSSSYAASVVTYNTGGTINSRSDYYFPSGDQMRGTSLALGPNAYYVGTLNGTSNKQMVIIRSPNDGTRTGTYGTGVSGTFGYSVSTPTDATATGTESAGTATGITPTLTGSTPTFTTSGTSYTNTVTFIT